MNENPTFFEKYEKTTLIIILSISFILRVLYLNFGSMWIDETISSICAQSIIKHGYPLLDSGAIYTRGLLFHYLMAFFIILSNILNINLDIGAKFISVIFGVLTVYLGYLFGKKFMKSSNSGLIFALLISVFSLEIIYSKQARFYQAFQFFYYLSFYLFYKFIILKEKYFKKRIFDILSIFLCIILSIDLQFMGYIIFPLLFIIYLIHNFTKENKYQILKNWKLQILLILSIIILYYITNNLIDNLNINFLNRSFIYGNLYINFLKKMFIICFLVLIGIMWSLKNNFKFTISLIIYTFVPFLGLFFIKVFATRYIYFIFFPLLYFLSFLIQKLKLKYILLVSLLVIYNGSIFDFNGIKEANYDSSMPISNFKESYIFIQNNSELNNLDIVSTWMPACKWYGKNCNYWINYSVSGENCEIWTSYNNGKQNVEIFSGAKIITNIKELPNNFVMVLDNQAKNKINKNYLNYFKNNCTEKFKSTNIVIFHCNITTD